MSTGKFKFEKLSDVLIDSKGLVEGALAGMTAVSTKNGSVVLQRGDDHDLSVIRRKGGDFFNWVIGPEGVLKVGAELESAYLRSANMDSKNRGVVYSFLFRFEFGHISFIHGKLILKDVSNFDAFIKEFKKFDSLFPI